MEEGAHTANMAYKRKYAGTHHVEVDQQFASMEGSSMCASSAKGLKSVRMSDGRYPASNVKAKKYVNTKGNEDGVRSVKAMVYVNTTRNEEVAGFAVEARSVSMI